MTASKSDIAKKGSVLAIVTIPLSFVVGYAIEGLWYGIASGLACVFILALRTRIRMTAGAS